MQSSTDLPDCTVRIFRICRFRIAVYQSVLVKPDHISERDKQQWDGTIHEHLSTRMLRSPRISGRGNGTCLAALRPTTAKAEYPSHHGRRHRLLEYQCLQSRHDGVP